MDDFWAGFTRFARGIFKKLLIADPLGSCTDQIFGADPLGLGTGYAWLGLVCFTLQIYFDFSGYSDMAIGLARMFGFRLRENFNMPYIARSLTEFWLRWHISLTTWIRDYLYIPLGGNRVSDLKIYRNLWICFLLSGLWHGANWNFVLWGAYNGLFLTLDRMFLRKALERSGPLLATSATILIVMIGWTIFRSPSLAHLSGYFAALAGATTNATAIKINPDVPATIVLGAALALLPATPLYPPLKRLWETARWPHRFANAGYVALYVVALARAFAVPFQPFIYFRF
jgi:alginate O-acetyltransferase complex protein AlgI